MKTSTKRLMVATGLSLLLKANPSKVITAFYFTVSLIAFCGSEYSSMLTIVLTLVNLALATAALKLAYK